MKLAWDKQTQREISPGFRARFVHTPTMTFALWEIDKGATLPAHRHPQEQVTNVLEGEFELVVDGVTHHLKPGMVTIIEPNVPHSGIALTDCSILDVFTPRREDYVFETDPKVTK